MNTGRARSLGLFGLAGMRKDPRLDGRAVGSRGQDRGALDDVPPSLARARQSGDQGVNRNLVHGFYLPRLPGRGGDIPGVLQTSRGR